MERFSIDNLLRYALAGGFTVLALLYGYSDSKDKLPKVDGFKEEVILLGLVLLIGSLVYVVHRAFIYPLFYRIGLRIVWRKEHWFWLSCPCCKGKQWGWLSVIVWCVRDPDIHIDMDRWSSREDPKSVRKNLGEWGAQVHYLYCATWSVLLGLWLGRLLGANSRSPEVGQLLVASCGLFMVAIIHHARLLFYERRISEVERHSQASANPDQKE